MLQVTTNCIHAWPSGLENGMWDSRCPLLPVPQSRHNYYRTEKVYTVWGRRQCSACSDEAHLALQVSSDCFSQREAIGRLSLSLTTLYIVGLLSSCCVGCCFCWSSSSASLASNTTSNAAVRAPRLTNGAKKLLYTVWHMIRSCKAVWVDDVGDYLMPEQSVCCSLMIRVELTLSSQHVGPRQAVYRNFRNVRMADESFVDSNGIAFQDVHMLSLSVFSPSFSSPAFSITPYGVLEAVAVALAWPRKVILHSLVLALNRKS